MALVFEHWFSSKTARRAAAVLSLASLALAGCAEPPEAYDPGYLPPVGGALPPPASPAVSPYGAPAQGWPSQPQDSPIPELPQATPSEGPDWTEPPLNAPTGTSPTPSAPAPASATPPASGTDRFDSLKNSMEHNVAPAASSSDGNASSAASNACTNVRQRNGFHDHYGGLNSAGDVLQTCQKPAN